MKSISPLVFAAILSIPAAHAGNQTTRLAVSNLDQPTTSNTAVGENFPGNDLSKSFSFKTGSSENLAGITLKLQDVRVYGLPPVPFENFHLDLRSDSGGLPGSTIASFTVNPADMVQSETFFSITPTALVENQTYWIVASAPHDTRPFLITLETTYSPEQTGLPGWEIGDSHYAAHTAGGAWSLLANVPQFSLSVVNPDQSPPVVNCITTPELIWPPDHKMVTVQIFLETQDETTLPENLVIVSATLRSNEPDTGIAAGDRPGDCAGEDGFIGVVDVTAAFSDSGTTQEGGRVFQGSVALRAERAGRGDGRVYTVRASVADEAGNIGTCSSVVIIRHDLGQQ